MQRKKKFRFTMSLLLILSILSTYGGVLPVIENNVLKVEGASQKILAQNKLTIYRKETLQLRAFRTSNKVSWTSVNPSVASISTTGQITGRATGTTTIIGTINGKKYKCKVIVKSCLINKPIYTSNPVTTNHPVYTSSPVTTNHPVYTSNPATTNYPVYTSNPATTNYPVYTSNPVTTNYPVYTSSPVTTNHPVYTSSPIATNRPVYTSSPVTTNRPIYTSSPVTTNRPIYTQTPVQNVPTESEVYQSMIKMKEKYPEGMPWTNNDYYRWKGGIYSGGYGCVAFAFLLSDAAFGDLPARKHTDFSNIKVGDILRINNDTHSVIILEVDANKVVVAEGNYNSSIHWGRTFERKNIEKIGNYVLTRYPQN